MKELRILFMAPIFAALLCSCGDKGVNQRTGVSAQAKILATVNNVSITEFDVQQALRRLAHGGGVADFEAAQKNILQTLIRDELVYQKAVELGLDRNQEYQRKVREFEAQLRAFQRHEMASLFLNNLRMMETVTDADVQAYFERHVKRIQTRFHLGQIYYRGNPDEIAKDYQDLRSGMVFEQVASRRFPKLPTDVAPWDLGYLAWSQIPEPWQGVLDRLDVGQTSDIIKGAGERFWIIKLMDKTNDPNITFAMEKERVVEVLRKQRTDDLYAKMLSEMQGRAKIDLMQ